MAAATDAGMDIMPLAERLTRLKKDAFVLVTVPADRVMDVNLSVVRQLVALGYGGVYVSLSKDYLTMAEAIGSAGIDESRLKFVDAISRMYGVAPVESPDVVYVDGPLSIDGLIDGIAASIKTIQSAKKFVLLDSLTTVSLYNSPEDTVAFGNGLRKLLKKEGAAGYVIVAHRDGVDRGLIDKIGERGEVIDAGNASA